MKQHVVRIALGLAITLFFIGYAARFYDVGLIQQLDNIIYDTRLKLTMPGKGDSRVVILDIDEKSLGEIGRWPWSRNVMARLMDKLFDKYGVAIVGFDAGEDKIDLWFDVTGIDATLRTGRLSTTKFSIELAYAVDSEVLQAHHAVLFKASTGNMAEQLFLVIDVNGIAGYQTNQDLVIHLSSDSSLSLSLETFI